LKNVQFSPIHVTFDQTIDGRRGRQMALNTYAGTAAEDKSVSHL